MGIYLEESERILEGEEPFSLDGLDRYILGELLIKKSIAG